MLIVVAEWLFRRIESGQLFLWPFPFDRAPDALELIESRDAVRTWRIPALLTLPVLTVLVLRQVNGRRRAPRVRPDSRPFEKWLLIGLLGATAADLTTTLWFCHTQSLVLEVHPGIRLFGYAFGRTSGPLIAKILQLTGILAIGHAVPALRAPLFLVSAGAMLLASVHNMLQ